VSVTRIFLTNTSLTSWTVPSDWTSNNTVEVIAGGAGGVNAAPGGGGGGGSYSLKANIALTPGSNVSIGIGVGGATTTAGGNTWFNGNSLSNASVSAQAGQAPSGGTGGLGGNATVSIGTTKFSGGNGGTGNTNGHGGGGGAGGPNGTGASGGSGGPGGSEGSAGGGGSGGGSAGSQSLSTTGGAGGNNFAGSGGGVPTTVNGGAGTAGGGGAGAGNAGGLGGAGGAGTEWDATHGSGGGGGGDFTAGTAGGVGGLYGGGGGGRRGAVGAPGLIVVSYTSSNVSATISGKTPLPSASASGTRGETASVGATTLGPSQTATDLAIRGPSFSFWGSNGSDTLTANTAVAPDGTTTATHCVPSAINTSHYLYYGSTYGPGTYTFSVYAKAAGYPRIAMRVYDGTAYRMYTTFDINVGSVVVSTAGTPSIYPVGNGWFRCVVTGTSPTATFGSLSGWCIDFLDSTHTTQQAFLGDGVSGVYLWGGQVQSGNITSYIPTPVATSNTAVVGQAYGYVGVSGTLAPKTLVPTASVSATHKVGVSLSTKTLSPVAAVQAKGGESGVIGATAPMPTPGVYTNLWTNSRIGAGFNFSLSTIVSDTSGFGIAPDGTNSAIRIQGTSTNWASSQTIIGTPSGNGTISMWVKSNTGSSQLFRLFGSTGVISGNFTATTSWQRFSFTTAYTAPNWGICRDSTNDTGDYLVWGPQFELGSVMHNYVPTGANSVVAGFAYGAVGESAVVNARTVSPNPVSLQAKVGERLTLASTTVPPKAALALKEGSKGTLAATTGLPVALVNATHKRSLAVSARTLAPSSAFNAREGVAGSASAKTVVPNAAVAAREGAAASVSAKTALPASNALLKAGERLSVAAITPAPRAAVSAVHKIAASVSAKTLAPSSAIQAREGARGTISATAPKPSASVSAVHKLNASVAASTGLPRASVTMAQGNRASVSSLAPRPTASVVAKEGARGSVAVLTPLAKASVHAGVGASGIIVPPSARLPSASVQARTGEAGTIHGTTIAPTALINANRIVNTDFGVIVGKTLSPSVAAHGLTIDQDWIISEIKPAADVRGVKAGADTRKVSVKADNRSIKPSKDTVAINTGADTRSVKVR
jgi:hypothetical protein